jgi:hypothetical protein
MVKVILPNEAGIFGLRSRHPVEVAGITLPRFRDVLSHAMSTKGLCKPGDTCESFKMKEATPSADEIAAVEAAVDLYIASNTDAVMVFVADNDLDVLFVHDTAWGVDPGVTKLEDVPDHRNVLGDAITRSLKTFAAMVGFSHVEDPDDVERKDSAAADFIAVASKSFRARVAMASSTQDSDDAVSFISELASSVLPRIASSDQFRAFMSLHREANSAIAHWVNSDKIVIVALPEIDLITLAELRRVGKVITCEPVTSNRDMIELYTKRGLSTTDPLLFHGSVITDEVFVAFESLPIYRAPLTAETLRRLVPVKPKQQEEPIKRK